MFISIGLVKKKYSWICLSILLPLVLVSILFASLQAERIQSVPLPPKQVSIFGNNNDITSITKTQPSQFIISRQDDNYKWYGECIPQQIEIVGSGFSSLSNGDHVAEMQFPQPQYRVESIAQVVGRENRKSTAWPTDVIFLSDGLSLITTTALLTTSGNTFSFAELLTVTNRISATIHEETTATAITEPRDLIVYRPITISDSLWSSTGQTMLQYVYGGYENQASYSTTITFTGLLSQTDIFVTAVINDINNDGRELYLTAQTNEITRTQHITRSNQGNRLNIATITLPNVPTDTNKITLTLSSPSNTGDSAIISGININYRCPPAKTSFKTYLPVIKKPAYLYLPVILEPHRFVQPCQSEPETNATRLEAKELGPLKQDTIYCGAYNDIDKITIYNGIEYVRDKDYMYFILSPDQLPATVSVTIKYDTMGLKNDLLPYNSLRLYKQDEKEPLATCCQDRRADPLWLTRTISSPGDYYFYFGQVDRGGPKPWITYKIWWTLFTALKD